MDLSKTYDVLVVGGGPGGASAARFCSKKGFDTLLVEKRQEIGAPVRCAEGVGKGIENFVDVNSRWVSKEMEGAKIYSPDGTCVDMSHESAGGEVGYVLDRKIFDKELVRLAASNGAEIRLRTRATGIEYASDGIYTKLKRNGKELKIKSKILIGADGVESKIGRWTGIYDSIRLEDIESCAQYLVTGINGIDMNYTHFFLGNEIAPGGNAWIFPKGDMTANIGVVVLPSRHNLQMRPFEYLNKFIESRPELNQGKIIEESYGGVPVAQPLDSLVENRVMLVGDCARQSSPITGGGIINAIHSAKIASEVASEAFNKDRYDSTVLSKYDEKRESILAKNVRDYSLKNLFQSMEDSELNSVAQCLKGIEFDSLSITGLVSELIKNDSQLAEKIDETL